MNRRLAAANARMETIRSPSPPRLQRTVEYPGTGVKAPWTIGEAFARPPRFVLIVAAALVAALLTTAFATCSVWAAFALGVWGLFVAVAAVVDFRTARLPDRIVLPGLLFSLLAASLTGTIDVAVMGAALFGLPLLAAHLWRPDGMGFGDVKYSTLLGVGIGTIAVPLVLSAYLLASVIQAAVCIAARAGARPVPFGPALAVGSIATVIVALTRT